MAFNKTVCPISRDEFKAHARPMEVSFDGAKKFAAPKEMSTGSLGWGINEKITVILNGKAVTLQIGLNITVVGSKELPGANTAAA